MKRYVKSVLAASLSTMMLLSVAAGCSSSKGSSAGTSSSSGTSTSSAVQKKVTIKVAKWGDTSNKAKDPDYIIEQQWNKDHPDIQIALDIIPSDGYSTKITTAFSSGSAYDIFESGEGDFYKWVSAGVNQPLDTLIANDTSFSSASFSKSVYNMGNLGGKQYYLIKDYNPLVLYYNKKMFSAAGLTAPDENTTWDTLFTDAQRLTKKSGSKYTAYGIDATTWTYALYPYLQGNGTDVIDSNGKVDGVMNSAATVSALQKWFGLSMGANKVSPTSANLSSFGGDEKMLANNMLGMFFSGYWSAPTLTQNNADYGTAILPKDDKGDRASILMAAGYCISNKSANVDAAWQVLKGLTDDSAQQIRVKYDGVLPTSTALLDSMKSTIGANNQGIIDVLPYCNQPVGLRTPKGNLIDADFNTALQEIVQGKGGSIQDVLNATVQKIDSGK